MLNSKNSNHDIDIHKNYFNNLVNNIRSKWIAMLNDEAIQAFKDPGKINKSIILNNWWNRGAKEAWMPPCKKTDCYNCTWLRAYETRHNNHEGLNPKIEKIKNKPEECPVRNISSFLLYDNKVPLSDDVKSADVKNGLELLLDFFNVLLWLVDEASGTMYIAAFSPFPLYIAEVASKYFMEVKFRIGKGVIGYALHMEKGLCMTDMVTDPRSSNIFGNIVTSYFSYIGVPIKEGNNIIAYVSLVYPFTGAWHPEKGIEECPKESETCTDHICFYKKFESFLKLLQSDKNGEGYCDLIRYSYKARLQDKLYNKLHDASEIKKDVIPDFGNLLKNFCATGETTKDALGINYASIWEYNKQDFRTKRIVPKTAFANLKKAIIRKHRNAWNHYHPNNEYSEFIYDKKSGFIKGKIQDPIDIEIKGAEYAEFEILYDKKIEKEEERKIKDIVTDKCKKDWYNISKIIKQLVGICVHIYKQSYLNNDVEEYRINILKRKLIRGISQIVIKQWCTNNQHIYKIIHEEILGYLNSLNYLDKDKMDEIFDLMFEYKDNNKCLINKISEILDKGNVYINIWINLSRLYSEESEGLLQLAYNENDKKYEPCLLIGNKENELKIIRNFMSSTTYRVLVYIIDYLKNDGGLHGISEDEHIILSSKWSSYLSKYFNFFSSVEFHDCKHYCGILYKGNENNATKFIDKVKAVIESDNKHDDIINHLNNKKNIICPDGDSFLLFHVRRAEPWYYIYVSSEKLSDEKFDEYPILPEEEMNKFVNNIRNILKTKEVLLNLNNKKNDENIIPLFYWNIYGNRVSGEWNTYFEKESNDDLQETAKILNSSKNYLHIFGIHSLHGCLLELDKSALILIGRSILHPDNKEYTHFNPEQQRVAGIFSNIIKGRLSHEQFFQYGKESELTEIIGESPEIKKTKKLAAMIAQFRWPVLLLGESGVGKELFARTIHEMSDRKGKFVAVNCGGMPETLLEDELLGHKEGAFTGATSQRMGKFEEADGGTIFLDEIGDAPMKLQVSLLRVIETGELIPLGGNLDDKQKIDVRIICATNKELTESETGSESIIRFDLLNRINTFPIRIPPLKDRKEDIPLLVDRFIHECNQEYNEERKDKERKDDELKLSGMDKDALTVLIKENLEGNVRELKNIIRRAVAISKRKSGNITRKDIENVINFSKGDYSFLDIQSNYQEKMEKYPFEYMEDVLENKLSKKQRMEKTGLDEGELKRREITVCEKCLEGGTIETLKERLGKSKPTLYKYFGEALKTLKPKKPVV
ncbi:MAG: AAA domain-containing protein [Desulfobacterales bacterium]|nr:AAA domain-containing protein [Desulfobacterales bacterium]